MSKPAGDRGQRRADHERIYQRSIRLCYKSAFPKRRTQLHSATDRGEQTAFRCAQAFDCHGADLGFVKDWLGHANTQKTIIYTVLTVRKQGASKVFMQLRSY
jgi:integrase